MKTTEAQKVQLMATTAGITVVINSSGVNRVNVTINDRVYDSVNSAMDKITDLYLKNRK